MRGVRLRDPGIGIVRVQEAGVRGFDDERVLAWAAVEGRILVSHDSRTMPPAAYLRIDFGLPMPGLVIIPQDCALGKAIADLEMIALCSTPEEWNGRVTFLPL